jgi:hypothetical protein
MTNPSHDTDRAQIRLLLRQFVDRKIQLRAYELYLQRGRAEGHSLDDWVNAEAEVLRGSILSPLFRKL